MTIGERIKHFRKDILKMTQQDFSASILISRPNLGNIETNAINVTDRVIALICEKHSVNEEWLREGIGPVFKENQEFNFDDYIKMKDASDLELEILKAYFDLDPEIRRTVINHFMDRLKPKVYYDQEADPYNLVEIVNSNRKEAEELLEKNNRNVVGE